MLFSYSILISTLTLSSDKKDLRQSIICDGTCENIKNTKLINMERWKCRLCTCAFSHISELGAHKGLVHKNWKLWNKFNRHELKK